MALHHGRRYPPGVLGCLGSTLALTHLPNRCVDGQTTHDALTSPCFVHSFLASCFRCYLLPGCRPLSPQECGFMGPEVGKCQEGEKYEVGWGWGGLGGRLAGG